MDILDIKIKLMMKLLLVMFHILVDLCAKSNNFSVNTQRQINQLNKIFKQLDEIDNAKSTKHPKA